MTSPSEETGTPGDADGALRDWYSNEIWGRRLDDDDVLFEVMCLQVFQAGSDLAHGAEPSGRFSPCVLRMAH